MPVTTRSMAKKTPNKTNNTPAPASAKKSTKRKSKSKTKTKPTSPKLENKSEGKISQRHHLIGKITHNKKLSKREKNEKKNVVLRGLKRGSIAEKTTKIKNTPSVNKSRIVSFPMLNKSRITGISGPTVNRTRNTNNSNNNTNNSSKPLLNTTRKKNFSIMSFLKLKSPYTRLSQKNKNKKNN